MSEQFAEKMTRFPMFQGFTFHGAKRLLEAGEVRHYSSGATVMTEGDQAASVLLILNGQMQVFVERLARTVVLKEIGEGAIVGELAVLCGIQRTASVRSEGDSTALYWTADAFRTLLLQDAALAAQIFRESLKMLLEKERALIDAAVQPRA